MAKNIHAELLKHVRYQIASLPQTRFQALPEFHGGPSAAYPWREPQSPNIKESSHITTKPGDWREFGKADLIQQQHHLCCEATSGIHEALQDPFCLHLH